MSLFLEKMRETPCVGIFSKTTDSSFVEATGMAGLDFIILDTEHGSVSYETLHNHVRASALTPMMSIIRVKGVDAHAISASLDTGADGVQIPNINTAAQARAAVDAARFHPVGTRGVCRFVRSASYGSKERHAYFSESNKKIVILQVEGKLGVSNLDEILSVPGFDILFVGPYDLSQSIGKIGDINSPEVLSLINTIARKAKDRGVLLGAFCDTLDGAFLLKSMGFSYIAYSVDVSIYFDSCSKLKEIVK